MSALRRKRKAEKIYKTRLYTFMYVAVPLLTLLLIANLFYIQVRYGAQFREQADNQYIVATHHAFERGEIYFQDKNGERVIAAGQRRGFKVSVNPQTLDNKEGILNFISEHYSDFDIERISSQLYSPSRTYVEILTEQSEEQVQMLREAFGSDIQIHSEKWRTYPLGDIASHVLGFLAYQGDEYAGRYGLERFYESTLVRNNQDLYTNFFARVFHGAQDLAQGDLQFEGDLVTSIEPQVQIYLEDQIEGIQERWGSEITGGIIVNPRDGSVYALGMTPGFNPNEFEDYSLEDFSNPLVESVYEMGSIVKPLVVAAAWDAGDITENTTYNDVGFVHVGPHTIYNFDKRGRGEVDVQDILDDSLNTGMVYISRRMDKDDFRSYFQNYGFGTPTGVDLPNDVGGLVSNLQSNRDIEFANMSFGQGIAVSPMSIVSATSALANEGMTVTPHIVDRIEYENGLQEGIDVPAGQQVLNPETAQTVTQMLVNTYDAYRDGSVQVPGYSIAAKTGTAQIPSPDGGYYEDRNLHSFVGYFPAYDPEFLVFLYTVHPKRVRYSSETLLNPFRDMVQYLVNYYEVAPDRSFQE